MSLTNSIQETKQANYSKGQMPFFLDHTRLRQLFIVVSCFPETPTNTHNGNYFLFVIAYVTSCNFPYTSLHFEAGNKLYSAILRPLPGLNEKNPQNVTLIKMAAKIQILAIFCHFDKPYIWL